MKYYSTIVMLLISTLTQAQTKIKFTYDTAGNQTSRILCINCSAKPGTEVEAVMEEEDQFIEEDFISYYPNPVKEELHINWEFKVENYVTLIQVFSLTGQVLYTAQVNKNTTNHNIFFQSYPAGVYIVSINYKSGGPKTIKIIKQ